MSNRFVNSPTLPGLRLFSRFTALAALSSVSLLRAQDSGSTPGEEEIFELEAFEVTGSNIPTLVGEATPVPTFTYTLDQLEKTGAQRFSDLRWAITEFGASSGFNNNMVNSGTSRAQTIGTSFNLRGLGENTTLVLVDGRRLARTGQEAPGGAGGREDFNLDGIPLSAISRIEVLPTGASAIYGADAIAGVINIILKDNYSGGETSISYENTVDSDAANFSASFTGGMSQGKLSVFATLGYEKQNALSSTDRWFSASYDRSAWGGSDSTLYQPVSGSGALSNSYYPLYYTTGYADLPGLDSYYVAIPSGANGSNVTIDDYAAAGYDIDTFDPAEYSNLIDEQESRSALLKVDYDLSDKVNLYGSLRWSESSNYTEYGPITATTLLPAGVGGNPFDSSVYVSKVYYDLERPTVESTFENIAVEFGVEGEFGFGWDYDANYSFARNVVQDDTNGIGTYFNYSLLSAALASDAPPILVYDSTDAANNPNPDGFLESLAPAWDHEDTSDVTSVSFRSNGTLFEGWAGPIRGAVGLEWMREEVVFWREPGNPYSYVLTDPFSRDTKSATVETRVPIVGKNDDMPLLHEVSISAAARYDDIDEIGDSTTTQLSGVWKPVDWMTLRATRGEGFKAPRLYLLKGPTTTNEDQLISNSWTSVYDPENGGELIDYEIARVLSGGNPNLEPESSVSRTAGVIFEVPFFDGLSFSFDHWETDYTNKAGSTSYQNLLDFYPERITRDGTGMIVEIDGRAINLGQVDASGVDMKMRYVKDFEVGTLSFNASYTKPDIIVTIATPGANPSLQPNPKRGSASLFWSQGKWEAGFTVNWQDSYYYYSSRPEVLEWNPRFAYTFDKVEGGTDASWYQKLFSDSKVSVSVTNLLDKSVTTEDLVGGSYQMDPRLKRYSISFTKKL